MTTGTAMDPLQISVGIAITIGIALLTVWKVRQMQARAATAGADGADHGSKDVFLAGGGLSWLYVAGSITLTNLSTEQLVGMNGNQMLLLAWWEICGFVGLMILAFVFVPVYYRHGVTTVTELLERRYGGRSIRTVISFLFMFGAITIYLPAALYSGSLFLQSMLQTDISLLWFAAPMAIIAAAYTVFGGLRAVAVMDTFSGIGVLAIALLVVILALAAVDFDLFGGVPAERISMVGATDSPIPFHTLFTGMLFIQIFYWSTNQIITQKAMTAPTVREAQKGVLAAAVVRILIIPAIVVIPGVVAYKLFGDVNDAAYGRVVAEVLPGWMSGAFAALMAAAVIAHTSAILNGTVALYTVDFHDKFVAPITDARQIASTTTVVLTISSIALVPVFANAESIINLLQQLNGLASMPILSAFIVGLMFRNVDARAAVAGVVWGFCFYASVSSFEERLKACGLLPDWFHYIDAMLLTLITSVIAALLVNRLIFRNVATYIGFVAVRGAEVQHDPV
jgi:solute:Na+ symporter, SSS family